MTGRGFITLIQIDVQQQLTIKAFLTYLSYLKIIIKLFGQNILCQYIIWVICFHNAKVLFLYNITKSIRTFFS